MKYLKTYEHKKLQEEVQKGLEKFFIMYNLHSNSPDKKHKHLDRMKWKEIPEFLFDEFMLLDYYYGGVYDFNLSYFKSNNYININDKIKNKIKKIALERVINKIESNYNYFIEIKDFLNKNSKFNTYGTFNYERDSSIRYFYFFLENVVKESPIAKTINKYNI